MRAQLNIFLARPRLPTPLPLNPVTTSGSWALPIDSALKPLPRSPSGMISWWGLTGHLIIYNLAKDLLLSAITQRRYLADYLSYIPLSLFAARTTVPIIRRSGRPVAVAFSTNYLRVVVL
jgi:hypothetical protein